MADDDDLRALRVTPHGAITDVWLATDTGGRLTAMYEHVGCSLVESVSLGDGVTMWCDEEGFLTSRPEANLCAIGIAARNGITAQPFIGTVLFTGGPGENGATRELTPEQALALRRGCERVIRFAVAGRITQPRQTPMDEVRAVQNEWAPDAGIGAR